MARAANAFWGAHLADGSPPYQRGGNAFRRSSSTAFGRGDEGADNDEPQRLSGFPFGQDWCSKVDSALFDPFFGGSV